MKNSQLVSLIFVTFFSCFTSHMHAQVLDKIDNDFDDSSFSTLKSISYAGGTDDKLFFTYTRHNGDIGISRYQNGDIGIVSFLDEIYTFAGQDIQNSYVLANTGRTILRFGHNPADFEVINAPPNYADISYSGYYDSGIYFQIVDATAQSIDMAKYENGTFTIFPSPDDLRFTGFGWPINDDVVIQYRSQDNRRFLYQFDGTDITVVDTPSNLRSINLSHRVGDLLYLSIESFDNESTFYSYDGVDLVEVSPSGDVEFEGYIGSNSANGEIYLTYKNDMNEIISYVYEGATFTTMSLPTGKSISGLSNIFEGISYFTLADNGTDLQSLYKFETGNFTEVVVPVGYSVESYLDDSDRPIYLLEDIEEKRSIAGLDNASNSLQIFADPAGDVQFVEYYAVLEQKIFTKYLKDSVLTLMMYDGSNYTEVWPDEWPPINPEFLDSYAFEKVIVKDNGSLYLAYERKVVEFPGLPNLRSDLLLYKLNSANGKPTSEDNMITADAGSNYSFSLADFPFQDPDSGDALHSIIITDINLNGELTLSGQNIEILDTILSQDIANMTFVPLMGVASFLELSYKVGDGLHYSTADYTFTLTLEQTNALPTSTDGSATTFINQTYTFSEVDFDFNDEDDMDSLHSILITEIGQVGSLKVNEEDVETGDTVLRDMIGSLSFVPPTDLETTSSFQYKVGDGKDYSEAAYTLTIEVVEDPFVNVEDILEGASIDIYPIPAKGLLNLKINADTELGDMTIKLYSTLGQLVFEQEFTKISKHFKSQLNLDGLVSGTYYLVGQTDIGSFDRMVIVE